MSATQAGKPKVSLYLTIGFVLSEGMATAHQQHGVLDLLGLMQALVQLAAHPRSGRLSKLLL